MRINKFVALATGMSRRTADAVVAKGRVKVNGVAVKTGQDISTKDSVTLDGSVLAVPAQTQTIILHKPTDYVVSREGQGSKTVYDLLPSELHHLKPIGRLDKNSSGLLLLTNDGRLAEQLTHPKYQKTKLYEITLDKPLASLHRQIITDKGIMLDDGISRFGLTQSHERNDRSWQVTMQEGRNRQIRRTFAALGYEVTRLHRTQFGTYTLHLAPGKYELV
ncbi:MAG TPA: pseudouridine synthase [Candidatus Saccharimonadales bacterium]|nr:pseudouridine synthase [Candidatus Saccharimonadales bacterium]